MIYIWSVFKKIFRAAHTIFFDLMIVSNISSYHLRNIYQWSKIIVQRGFRCLSAEALTQTGKLKTCGAARVELRTRYLVGKVSPVEVQVTVPQPHANKKSK